jgi:hypothetical protein
MEYKMSIFNSKIAVGNLNIRGITIGSIIYLDTHLKLCTA